MNTAPNEESMTMEQVRLAGKASQARAVAARLRLRNSQRECEAAGVELAMAEEEDRIWSERLTKREAHNRIDAIAELLAFAKSGAPRPDWREAKTTEEFNLGRTLFCLDPGDDAHVIGELKRLAPRWFGEATKRKASPRPRKNLRP